MLMQILPRGAGGLAIYPETEVEAFFVRNFLEIWRKNMGSIEIADGLYGAGSTVEAKIVPFSVPLLEVANFIKK